MELFTTSAKTTSYPKVTPQQSQILNQLLSMGFGGLQNLMQQPQQPFNIDPILQRARTQFQTETIPSLAERFSALPGQGGQRSSAFAGSLGAAGSGLEEALAALQAQSGLQQQEFGLRQRGQEMGFLQNLLGLGLSPQFDTAYQAPQLTFLGSLLGNIIARRFGKSYSNQNSTPRI